MESRYPLYEVGFATLSVMAVIWIGGSVSALHLAVIFPALFLMVLYWIRDGRSFWNLWRPAGNKIDYVLLAISFLSFWTTIIQISNNWNPEFWENPVSFEKYFRSVLFYFGNALWQQALINGYFYPRLEEGFRSEKKALLALGFLFGIVHLPNPVLVPVTMVGGIFCAYFFKRTRNIYALIAAHAILAVSIMYFLPHSWHHHLTVGKAYLDCKK